MSDDGSMSPRRRKQQLTTQANSDSLIPGGDPIERIRNTPKESLIQRANSPRRQQFSSPGSNLSKEISLELLPRIKGKKKLFYCKIINYIVIHILYLNPIQMPLILL